MTALARNVIFCTEQKAAVPNVNTFTGDACYDMGNNFSRVGQITINR